MAGLLEYQNSSVDSGLLDEDIRKKLAREMAHAYQGSANDVGPLANALQPVMARFTPQFWQQNYQDAKNTLSDLPNQLSNFPPLSRESMRNAPPATPEEQERIMSAMNAFGPSNLGFGAIVSPMKAKTLNTIRKLPDDDIFRQAIANTPGAQITEDGLLMNIQRGQQPDQSMRPSVRGGVFYLPEGAAQMKHYSTGKQGYGGPEKIKGETLVTNPLFVKGGTGGKAPESAYDSLHGKGSYQSMRDDALKVLGFNLPKNEMASRADEFLDKYAPEMSGMGEYIVKSSTKGNQLPYALQEAAVSSAVRRAGHDAVLGYSKGKSGYFVSELFDVRESHYPDKFGGSRIFNQFEGLLE